MPDPIFLHPIFLQLRDAWEAYLASEPSSKRYIESPSGPPALQKPLKEKTVNRYGGIEVIAGNESAGKYPWYERRMKKGSVEEIPILTTLDLCKMVYENREDRSHIRQSLHQEFAGVVRKDVRWLLSKLNELNPTTRLRSDSRFRFPSDSESSSDPGVECGHCKDEFGDLAAVRRYRSSVVFG